MEMPGFYISPTCFINIIMPAHSVRKVVQTLRKDLDANRPIGRSFKKKRFLHLIPQQESYAVANKKNSVKKLLCEKLILTFKQSKRLMYVLKLTEFESCLFYSFRNRLQLLYRRLISVPKMAKTLSLQNVPHSLKPAPFYKKLCNPGRRSHNQIAESVTPNGTKTMFYERNQ